MWNTNSRPHQTSYVIPLHAYCDGVEGRPRFGRRPAVAEAEVTGEAESDELKGSARSSVGFAD